MLKISSIAYYSQNLFQKDIFSYAAASQIQVRPWRKMGETERENNRKKSRLWLADRPTDKGEIGRFDREEGFRPAALYLS